MERTWFLSGGAFAVAACSNPHPWGTALAVLGGCLAYDAVALVVRRSK